MVDPSSTSELRHRRLVTVLRLVLDRRGLLVHGEIVDDGNRRQGRFAGWDRLVPALRALLQREPENGERRPVTDLGAR